MKLDEQPEYEANLFAALLLVDRGEMAAMLREGYTVSEVSKALRVDANFIALLLHAFGNRKITKRVSELPRANFLR